MAKNLKLYKISQTVNIEYDTFDSAIVVAESKEKARLIRPDDNSPSEFLSWCSPEHASVRYLGLAAKRYTVSEVILASFNAG